jgi:hypothetical protein
MAHVVTSFADSYGVLAVLVLMGRTASAEEGRAR